jgi:hypothetical protein
LAALAAVFGINPRSGQAEPMEKDEQKVIVYVENDASVPNSVLFPSKAFASELFAGVGIRIDWRAGRRSESQLVREGAVAVRLARTPKQFKLSDAAFAFPYGKAHITVLYDRLAWSERRPGLATTLLAYVLVHEITHKLEGICRHSSAGVMKSNWAENDYYEMEKKTLPFASEDIDLIQRGLAQRYPRMRKGAMDGN